MDVTAENFRSALPLVFSAINNADFVAFDGEFSGLRRSSDDQVFDNLDTIEERYTKVAASVRDFALLQLGLSCFRFNSGTQSYDTATFSFYLLKAKTAISRPNIFTACSNSLRFLSEQHFDFNKLFSSGIPYLNQRETLDMKDKITGRITERLAFGAEKPAAHVTSLLLYKEISSYIRKTARGSPAAVSPTRPSAGDDIDVYDPQFSVSQLLEEPVARLHSPAGYTAPDHAAQSFHFTDLKRSSWDSLRGALVTAYTNVDASINYNNCALEVRVFATKQDRDVFVYCDVMDDFYNTVGFTHVINHLLSSDKPLVGHTSILDVCHVVDKCLEPIPLELEAFKELYRSNFAVTYDTKVIARNAPFAHTIENTSLENVFSSVVLSKFRPSVTTMEGYESYSVAETSRAHDAGYDAFMTGVAFAGMVRRLDGSRSVYKSAVHSKHLQPYINRTHLMRICDISILNFAADDELVNRRGIVVVESKTEIQYPQLKSLFSAYTCPSIVNSHSSRLKFYVLPSNEDDIKHCRKLLNKVRQMCPADVTVSLYPHDSMAMHDSVETYDSVAAHDSMDTSHTTHSPVASPYCCTQLSPRTAQLVTTSTLNARSPEFRPAGLRKSSPCSLSLDTPLVPEDTRHQTVHQSIMSEDSGTEPNSSIEMKNENKSPSRSHSRQSNNGSVGSEFVTTLKRGEKRKSGQYNDMKKSVSKSSTTACKNVETTSKSKAGEEDWHTVRNRNKNKVWSSESTSAANTNRFLPSKKEEESTSETKSQGKKRRSKRTPDTQANMADSGAAAVAATATASQEYDGITDCRELKRLKSVGSEQMSHLTLNSPTSDQSFPVASGTAGDASCTSDSSPSCNGGSSATAPGAAGPGSEDGGADVASDRRRRSRGGGAAGEAVQDTSTDVSSDSFFVVPDQW